MASGLIVHVEWNTNEGQGSEMMKRPMGVVGLALTLTTWAAFFFSPQQALLLSAAMAVTGLAVAVLSRQNEKLHRVFAVGVACMAAAVGFALHAYMEQTRIDPFYAAAGQTVQAEGVIEQARLSSRTIKYTVRATFPERPDLPRSTIVVRTYGEMDYLAGEVIRFAVTLEPESQPQTGLRLAPEDVLKGTLEGEPELIEGGYAVRRILVALREGLCDNVYTHLTEQSADIVTAMVLGQDDNISSEAYASVSRAGTIHLFSVSGLHLSVLTAMVLALLGRLGIGRRLRSLLAIFAAAVFMVLVGFSAPIVRAFAMTALTLFASMLRREKDSLSALGAAVTVICLIWPGWVLSWGFWLSAGSTLGILLFGETLSAKLYQKLSVGGRLYNRLMRAVISSGAVSIAAYAVTLPMLVLMYGWISLVSPLANILIAPFVPVVMAGGIVCAMTGSEMFLIRLVAFVTDLSTMAIMRISEVIGSIPCAILSLDELWMLVWFGFVLVVLFVLWRLRAGRQLALYGLTLLVFCFSVGEATYSMVNRDRVELAVIEQSDAAVLLCGREAVILGTPDEYEVGWLVRYLQYRGTEQIRAVIAADCGEQISSGLLRLAENYPIDCIIGPNDAYILEMLAGALPEIPVYSGGYANIQVLGSIGVELELPDGDVLLQTPRGIVRKTTTEYTAPDPTFIEPVVLHPENALCLNGVTGLVRAPLGGMLYGETRIWLN